MMKNSRFANSRFAGLLGVVIVVVVGLLSGMAVAGPLTQEAPAGISASSGGAPAESVTPDYPVNESGQTYGAADQAVLPEHEPDLILAIATNGDEGYVEKSVLDEITGANVASPSEAVEWQLAQEAASWDRIEIPVFDSDGRTQIGVFEISRSILNYSDPAEDG